MKNYYQTLGIKKNATQDEIKKAYRKLAVKFHPDKNIGDDFFDDLFREIKIAYDILSNPASRRNYDLQYKSFINKVNFKESSTYQYKQTQKEYQTSKTNSDKDYLTRFKNFNLQNLIIDRIVKFRTSTLKDKFVFLYQFILILILLLGFYVNGFSGFFTVIGFYLFTFLFIDSIKNFNDIDSLGSGIVGLLVAPIIAILIFGQGLEYYRVNPFVLFENNRKVENNKPNKLSDLEKSTLKSKEKSISKQKDKEATKSKDKDLSKVKIINERAWMDEETRKSIREINEFSKRLESDEFKTFEKLKVTKSKYRGNQLKNGASPLDACFGKGIYSQNAWLKFENSNKSDAVVCLVRSSDEKTIRNEYIRAGAQFKMSKIPSGIYYIKVYYGNDWNPNKKNFCGIKGAFERNVSYSKSDKIGDQIKIENTKRSYTTGTITLYAVINGNMSTETINEKDFFGN